MVFTELKLNCGNFYWLWKIEIFVLKFYFTTCFRYHTIIWVTTFFNLYNGIIWWINVSISFLSDSLIFMYCCFVKSFSIKNAKASLAVYKISNFEFDFLIAFLVSNIQLLDDVISLKSWTTLLCPDFWSLFFVAHMIFGEVIFEEVIMSFIFDI